MEENRQELADGCYDEIGRSIAGLVVEGGVTPNKAWSLISGLGLYNRWMVTLWVDRYRRERNLKPKRSRRKPKQNRRKLLDQLGPIQRP